jgi:hypothetical protein
MTVTVAAQWAVYGRAADMAGFRVLSCSTGVLNRENFGEVISRFNPGTLDALPQVTVSYVSSGATDGNYLALAIHKFAEQDHGVRSDETGRPVVFTSYFCVPYLPLASAAIGYLPLYLALRSIKLPVHGDGPPLPITVTAPAAATVAPAVSALANQVAALLVTTGRPACVIGANSASLAERLQFVDTVMALLPYGQRTRMTAATWVRPTHRDHRFRLYFSDAPRDRNPADHVVWWGRPDQTALTQAHGNAYEYQRFLEDEARRSAARLSGLTDPHGFKLDDLRGLLASLGITEPEQATGAPKQAPEDEADLAQPVQGGQTPAHSAGDLGEIALEACAAHAKVPNLTLLAADIAKLKRITAAGALIDGQRASCRELIARHGLFRHNPRLGQQEGRLYDALLDLAFGKPLSYAGYCQVEDCLGNPPDSPPHRSLLWAIERQGMGDAPVTALVLTYLSETRQLHKQFESPLFDAVQLIGLLTGDWRRPQHFRTVCEVTLDYLATARAEYELSTVRRALRRNGFLAQALQASGAQDQYQVHALYRLLQAAYPDRLNRTAITAVLRNNSSSTVTPALFAAVLLLLARPQDAELARDAYATASLTGLKLNLATASRVEQLLPVLDQTSGSYVKPRLPQPGATHGGSAANDDVPGPSI